MLAKGKVEALVRFTKSDLIPYAGFGSLDEANQAGAAWCAEVNAEIHYETRARPSERLQLELPLLRALPAGRPVVACGEERKVDPAGDGQVLLGALLGPASPGRRKRHGAGQ